MLIDASSIGAIYLRLESVDFRKGIIGLCSLVTRSFSLADKSKVLFVFTNRSRNRIRILYWDDTGYAYWHKALDRERFKWPKRDGEELKLSLEELRWLLSGINLDKIKKHKLSAAKSFF